MPKPAANVDQSVDQDQDQHDDVPSDRSDALVNSLFSDDPPQNAEKEQSTDEDQDQEQEQEEESQDEEQEEETSEDEEESSDDETDYDSDIQKKKKDDDDTDEFKDDSAAVKQAKLRGREVKELKAKLTERDLEFDKIQKERDELAARLEEVEATKIKPEDHPDYSNLRDEILTDVSEASDLLSVPDPSLVSKNFGVFMSDYLAMSALSGDERTEARAQLKEAVVDRLKLSEVPYAELDAEERKEYDGVVNDVLKIVQRNAGKTKDLQKLHTKLSEKAKVGLLSTGVRQYESTVNEFKPVLDAVGSLAEDVVEENPYAVESIVSKLVKESPEAAKRLEKAKRDVLEVIVGPRALTQTEIDKLEAAGENVKEFIAERAKAHRSKQLKFAAMFVQGLMTRPTLKETLARLSKLEKETEEEESELEVLRNTSKKTAKPKPKEPVRPKDRVSPLTSILGFTDDDE